MDQDYFFLNLGRKHIKDGKIYFAGIQANIRGQAIKC